jgi:hypothetical protein
MTAVVSYIHRDKVAQRRPGIDYGALLHACRDLHVATVILSTEIFIVATIWAWECICASKTGSNTS